MGFVVSLRGFRPSPRFDSIAWNRYNIQEAIAKTGPWVSINTGVALSPVDSDPTQPLTRNFTTSNATADSGLWYRVQFLDPNGSVESSMAVLNTLAGDVIPSSAEIRAESNVVFPEFGYPAPGAGQDDRLEIPINEAVTQFIGLTGVDVLNSDLTGDLRIPLIRRAIRMLTEYNVAGSQMEVLETAADFDMLSGFNAASYSETRRSVGRNSRILHPWPALDSLLGLIIYYDSNGHPVADGPGITVPCVVPRPGTDIVRPAFDLPLRGGTPWETIWPPAP